MKIDDIDTIFWSIGKLIEFEQERLKSGWELSAFEAIFKRLLFFCHRQSYRRTVYKSLTKLVSALLPENPGKKICGVSSRSTVSFASFSGKVRVEQAKR